MPVSPKERKNNFPLSIEKQYLRAVERYLNAINKEILQVVKSQVNIKEIKKDKFGKIQKIYSKEIRNDSIDDIKKIISDMLIKFERLKFQKTIEKTISNVVKSVRNFNNKINKKFLLKPDQGVFELPTVQNENLEGIINKNVELIKSVGKEYLSEIQQSIEDNIKQGKSQKELQDLLQKSTKVERNKAKFWASDQLGKINGDIQKQTQQQAGVEKFIWRTQLDSRVRDSHLFLEGKIFSWDKLPVVAGRTIKPGEDYNCRCFAEPYFEL